MKKLPALDMVALLLTVVGGLNWGLVGGLQYNLVDSLLGVDSMASRVVYVVVGLSAVVVLVRAMKYSVSE